MKFPVDFEWSLLQIRVSQFMLEVTMAGIHVPEEHSELYHFRFLCTLRLNNIRLIRSGSLCRSNHIAEKLSKRLSISCKPILAIDSVFLTENVFIYKRRPSA